MTMTGRTSDTIRPSSSHQSHEIRAIPRDAVHRICSGQVILDLATAVKELVENALDASASALEIRIQDHGTTSIEV